MAKIELSALSSHCLDREIPDQRHSVRRSLRGNRAETRKIFPSTGSSQPTTCAPNYAGSIPYQLTLEATPNSAGEGIDRCNNIKCNATHHQNPIVVRKYGKMAGHPTYCSDIETYSSGMLAKRRDRNIHQIGVPQSLIMNVNQSNHQ